MRAQLLDVNRTYFSEQKLFRTKRLTIGSKFLLYKTMILLVLMYSLGTWLLSKKKSTNSCPRSRKESSEEFLAFCMSIDGSLLNDEIYEQYQDRLLLDEIRLNRLRWAGYVIRMDEDDPAWKVYKGNIYDRKRRRGRPCLRWSNGLGQDARQLLRISNWWTSSQNQGVWSSLLRQA